MLDSLFQLDNNPDEYPQEVIDILRLIRSENVGVKTFHLLMKMFGDIKIALQKAPELSIKGGKNKPIKVFSKTDAQKEIQKLNKIGAKLISYIDEDYSKLLLQTDDFPPILSYIGNINLLKSKNIAIVGARNASINGVNFAKKIACNLGKHGITIVSGMARGIDTGAHRGALESNNTIAVLAGGIDHIYPSENELLYKEITQKGLIVSELPIGTAPVNKHFPQRNRIISGLSLGVLVVEASIASGSLITTRFAAEQNRDVFAVPGFPGDPRYKGNNKLIREGAYIVESYEDVINHLPRIDHKIREDKKEYTTSIIQRELFDIDQQTRKDVINALSITPVTTTILTDHLKLPLPVIYTVILELELAGKIVRYTGDRIGLKGKD